jgi:dethiobiotin synthetase
VKPHGYFVTGTDTGVGKTRAAVALCRAFAAGGASVAAMKPVASGCIGTPAGLRNEDALSLQSAATIRARYADVNPYAFVPAIAPHIAAAAAGVRIDLAVLDRAFERLRLQSEVIIVEGAGGWLAPLSEQSSFADLAVRWQLGVVLVVGLRLGCLNHALLSVEAIERRGVTLTGWIANRIDLGFEYAEQNLQTLTTQIAAPCLAEFAYDPKPDAAACAANTRAIRIELFGSEAPNRKSLT